MPIDDGGSLFPFNEMTHSISQDICNQHAGASVRDYFAAKAMQVLLPKHTYALQYGVLDGDAQLEELADDSYRVARAMLKARAK